MKGLALFLASIWGDATTDQQRCQANDAEEYVSPNLCVVCRKSLDPNWEYAACKSCADELDYDFTEDDRNFDAANGR